MKNIRNRNRFGILIFFVFSINGLFAQNAGTKLETEDSVLNQSLLVSHNNKQYYHYLSVDEHPKFEISLDSLISEADSMPLHPHCYGIGIYVKMFIDSNGDLVDIEPTSEGCWITKEVIEKRITSKIPRCQPAILNKKAVPVMYSIIIVMEK